MWQPQFISALSAILAVLGVACATPKKPVTVEPFHLTVCGIPQPKTEIAPDRRFRPKNGDIIRLRSQYGTAILRPVQFNLPPLVDVCPEVVLPAGPVTYPDAYCEPHFADQRPDPNGPAKVDLPTEAECKLRDLPDDKLDEQLDYGVQILFL